MALSLVGCSRPAASPVWCQVKAPTVGVGETGLAAVAALSPSLALAVGSSQATIRTETRTLGELWDGSEWRVVPTEDMSDARGQELVGLSVLSTSDAWAVGSWFPPPVPSSAQARSVPLVEQWDGTGWRVAIAPRIVGGALTGVMAFADDDVWTVGAITGSGSTEGIALHWDGTTWRPYPSTGIEWLAINGRSRQDLWIVGRDISSDRAASAHWDGSSWTQHMGDRAATTNASFEAVTEISSTDVWAVGSMDGGPTQLSIPLSEHWDGTAWRLITTPAQQLAASNSGMFEGVAGASRSDVWAVGALMSPHSTGDRMAGEWVTLTDHWDGSEWSSVDGPSPKLSTILTGVSRVPGSTEMWAVGSPQGNVLGPFTERTC